MLQRSYIYWLCLVMKCFAWALQGKGYKLIGFFLYHIALAGNSENTEALYTVRPQSAVEWSLPLYMLCLMYKSWFLLCFFLHFSVISSELKTLVACDLLQKSEWIAICTLGMFSHGETLLMLVHLWELQFTDLASRYIMRLQCQTLSIQVCVTKNMNLMS